jgi:membrane protease YdiL (CAAX protease family)
MLLLGLCSVCMLVCGGIGIGVLDHLSIKLPSSGAVPRGQGPLWALLQFGFVALPEELFFRGYFLTNCLKLLRAAGKSHSPILDLAGVCLSAGVFAVAHVLTLGSVASLLTFFPALVFAWLFLRCGSLLPPVLLHGLANIGYVLVLRQPM